MKFSHKFKNTPKRSSKKTLIPMPSFPNFDEDRKEYSTDFHSLFIEEVPEEQIPLDDEDGNIIPGIYASEPAYDVYKFYVGDFSEEGTGLHPILDRLSKANQTDYLEFHIDSNGGSVNEGKLFYDLINNFDPDNVAAFLSTGYSMGALLFCIPETRIVHEFSDLMFHDYSGMMYGKAGEMETSHNHSKSHIRNFFRKFTVDKGFLGPEEFEQMIIGKDFWMDTKEMCQRGIATHVKTVNGIIKAESYLESLEPKIEETKLAKPKTPRKPKVKETPKEG